MHVHHAHSACLNIGETAAPQACLVSLLMQFMTFKIWSQATFSSDIGQPDDTQLHRIKHYCDKSQSALKYTTKKLFQLTDELPNDLLCACMWQRD
jgi:hypothetical protein